MHSPVIKQLLLSSHAHFFYDAKPDKSYLSGFFVATFFGYDS